MTLRGIARRRWLAWLAPVVVAGVVAGGAVLATAAPSDATPVLPHLTAHRLLSRAVAGAGKTPALSGTVREKAALGLPELPGDYGGTSWSWQTFITGTHELKVQVDGPRRQRIALLGQLAEADVVHNGRDVWTYTSDTNTYTHTVLARLGQRRDMQRGAAALPLTPSSLASAALAAVRPSTRVSVHRAQWVAGRPAYTLVLHPRDRRSTVREVAIALDSATFVPLRVEIFGGATSPAFEVGFTDVKFTRPPASAFAFRPPRGAVRAASVLPAGDSARESAGAVGPRLSSPSRGSAPALSVLGEGWTSVVELRPGPNGSRGPVALPRLAGEVSTPVGSSGARLVRTALVNFLLRPDGAIFAGAVRPSVLEHAAAGAR